MLRFPLIFGVILIHSYGVTVQFAGETVGLEETPYATVFVENLLSTVVARVAVPAFFLISAFLFFQGFTLSRDVYAEKLRKRVRTLLVPYLIWNLLTLMIFFAAQSVPAFSGFFSGRFKPVREFGLYDYVNAFAGLDSNPVSYQLWFIRDLMLLVVLSPLVWFIVRRLPWLGLIAFFSVWMVDPPQLKYLNLSYTAIFFFYVGACVASRDLAHEWIDQQGKKLVMVYGAISLVTAFLITETLASAKLILYLSFFPGLLAVWYLAGLAGGRERWHRILMWLSLFSFFVYAAHEPTLTVLRKAAYRIVNPDTGVEVLVLYLTLPVLVVLLTLTAGYALRRTTPKLYDMMTGSR